MTASDTDSPEIERRLGLYFFPDRPISAEMLRALLSGDSAERRAWAISHLLRYADWEDIWQFTSREQVRAHFADLDLPPTLRTAWARILKLAAQEVPENK